MSRRKLVSVCLILVLSVFSTTAYSVGTAEAATHKEKKALAVKAALSKVGKPYASGAAGPNKFDCSGLTLWAYNKKAGIKLGGGHSAGGQYRALKAKNRVIPKSKAVRGDLVYYKNSQTKGHIGIYLGGGQMVHAPKPGDRVKISKTTYMKGAKFVRV